MAYISQIGSFQALQVLTASHVNQAETNIRDHTHGADGVSDIKAAARYAQDGITRAATTNGSFIVASFTVTSGSLLNRNVINWTGFMTLEGSGWEASRTFPIAVYYGATQVLSFQALIERGGTLARDTERLLRMDLQLMAAESLQTQQRVHFTFDAPYGVQDTFAPFVTTSLFRTWSTSAGINQGADLALSIVSSRDWSNPNNAAMN